MILVCFADQKFARRSIRALCELLIQHTSVRALLGALALLSACHQGPPPPPAPTKEGVCWRAAPAPPKFVVVTEDSPDLISCAMDLELVYLGEGRSLVGAYQGSYIFVGPGAVQSAAGLDLFRYPIFNKAQRAALDTQLRVVLEARRASTMRFEGTVKTLNRARHSKS